MSLLKTEILKFTIYLRESLNMETYKYHFHYFRAKPILCILCYVNNSKLKENLFPCEVADSIN